MPKSTPKPDWLRVRAPGGEAYHRLRKTLHGLELNTVCEHARCPNIGTCWREGTATVMLLGEVCTRGCRFCAVTAGKPGGVVDPGEPERVAEAIAQLDLRYVVLTMVTRDDLADGGAAMVADTVRRLHTLQPGLLVETLVSDFGGRHEAIDAVVDALPDVFAHNLEVVREWTPRVRDARSSYDRSLEVLARARERSGGRPSKSSLMVGVGETDDQVRAAMGDLRSVGVELLTIGQYLCPTSKHHAVARFVTPETFDGYRDEARRLGFRHVASGPLVRSSYRAAELFVESYLAGNSARTAPARKVGEAVDTTASGR
jgi:lipoic acid synthetase